MRASAFIKILTISVLIIFRFVCGLSKVFRRFFMVCAFHRICVKWIENWKINLKKNSFRIDVVRSQFYNYLRCHANDTNRIGNKMIFWSKFRYSSKKKCLSKFSASKWFTGTAGSNCWAALNSCCYFHPLWVGRKN